MGINDNRTPSQLQAGELDRHIRELARLRDELDPAYSPYYEPPETPGRFGLYIEGVYAWLCAVMVWGLYVCLAVAGGVAVFALASAVISSSAGG